MSNIDIRGDEIFCNGFLVARLDSGCPASTMEEFRSVLLFQASDYNYTDWLGEEE